MLIYLALLLPLVGGAVLPLFRFRSMRTRGLYVEALVLATSALVWAAIATRTEVTYTLYHITDALALTFRMDGMACTFAGLVALLWPLASLYGFEYMTHEERPDSFFAFYTMTYGIALGVALAGNLFTLYVFYECLTLITLPLVTHKKDAKSIRAGRKYLYFTISGAALAFIGLVFVIHYGATMEFTLGGLLDMAKVAGHERAVRLAFLMAFIGFGTKAAIFPLYAWLPDASVAPTPVTALLHAVAVVNTGAYAVLRLIYYTFGVDFLYGTPIHMITLGLSCFTILFGSTMAVREQHLKRRLAYSTVSNLSYMLMGAALMTPAGMVGSLSHLILHGVMKITLFFCAGAIIVRTERNHVQELRGLSRVMPATCAVFTFASVALVGIPPLCGFVSKWNLLTAAADTGLAMGTVAIATLIISAVLTAVYLFTVVAAMYFRPQDANDPAAENRDPSWQMKLPFALLCAAMVVLGMWSEPIVTFLRGLAAGTIF